MPPPLPSPRPRERSSVSRPGSGGSSSAFRISDSDARPGNSTGAALTRTSSASSVGANRENIRVTVRLRPFSEKERKRGDREVWSIVANNTVGLTQAIGARIKYAFDTVLGQHISNTQVYQVSCANIVASSLDGYNGTVFAYGVTSSGKTHTILGNKSDPGIVQQALQDIFAAVARSQGRDFLLALSMLEIYNEDLKDLLDPGRILKLREDAKRGFFVEGAKEEILLSPEHALAVMAHGQQHRTVSSTMYNECSSRSHTIVRLRIESSSHASSAGPATRSLSHLNFIDLAGSESAKVVVSKGHSKEGSYINRSLLTLSTVIAKLADGNAVHIPYRDSRLTRLLQNSLSGVGAKIAVIATITPASSQAEETHNTLKFATRAKRIEIRAERNEATDTSSLLIRYQLEIANLRAQLDQVHSRGLTPRSSLPDPLHPEIRNLRERLEEERHALSARDADKVVLEQRISRLTRLVLSSARATAAASRAVAAPRRGHTRTISDMGSVRRPQIAPDEADAQPDRRSGDVEAACAQVLSAGELIPGSGAVQMQQAYRPSYDWDREALCDQVLALTDELEARAKQLEILKRAMHSARSMSGDFERKESLPTLSHERNMSLPISHMRHSSMDQQRLQHETDIQMLAAEREFMAGQLKSASLARSRLQAHVAALQRQLHEAGMQPCDAPQLPSQGHARSRTTSRDAEGDVDGFESARNSYQDMLFAPSQEAPKSPFDSTEAPSPTGNTPLPTPGRAKFTADVIDRLGKMEGEVSVAVSEAERREAVMLKQRHALQQAQVELDSLRSQATRLSGENSELRAEAQRLELQDGHLQGYGLDDMANEQLAGLIVTLTQAVERVRVTVQLRRVQAATNAATPRPAPKPPMPTPPADGTAAGQHASRLDTVAAGKLAEAREKLREARHSMDSEPVASGSGEALQPASAHGSMELEASEEDAPRQSWPLLLPELRGSGLATSDTARFARIDSTDPPSIPSDNVQVRSQSRKSHEVVTEAAQQLAQGQEQERQQHRQENRQRHAPAQALSPARTRGEHSGAQGEQLLLPEDTDSASQLGNDPPRSHRISDDNMSLSAESSAPSLSSGLATPDRSRRGLLNVYGVYEGS